MLDYLEDEGARLNFLFCFDESEGIKKCCARARERERRREEIALSMERERVREREREREREMIEYKLLNCT